VTIRPIPDCAAPNEPIKISTASDVPDHGRITLIKTLGRNFDRMNVSRNRESMRCKSRRRIIANVTIDRGFDRLFSGPTREVIQNSLIIMLTAPSDAPLSMLTLNDPPPENRGSSTAKVSKAFTGVNANNPFK
jgi:hypothetical protein